MKSPNGAAMSAIRCRERGSDEMWRELFEPARDGRVRGKGERAPARRRSTRSVEREGDDCAPGEDRAHQNGGDVSRETWPLPASSTPIAAAAARVQWCCTLRQAALPRPRHRRVFTVANQKRWRGKATTAVNMARLSRCKASKTLVIDLDPQGNASTALGISDRRSGTPVVVRSATG